MFRGQKNEAISCKAKAVDLLARSDQSKQKLRQKLVSSKYSEEEIDDTIEWLEEKHYIKEEDCCKRRFENMYEQKNASVRQICAKLINQGFERDMVESIIPDDTYEHEVNSAYKIISRKFKPNADKRKMLQHLFSKGFSYEEANSAIESFADDTE